MKEAPSRLIVDDDSAVRTLLTTICGRLGLRVKSAVDGVEAIEKIAANGYDVVLLDLMMPRMNGFEVLDALVPATTRPAVIVITAQSEKQTSALVKHPVVHTVVRKPFDLEELQSALGAAMVG